MRNFIHRLRGHIPFTCSGKTYWWKPSSQKEESFDLVRFGVVGRIAYSRSRKEWCAHLVRSHSMMGYQPHTPLGSDPDMEKAMKLIENHVTKNSSTLNNFDSEFNRIRERQEAQI